MPRHQSANPVTSVGVRTAINVLVMVGGIDGMSLPPYLIKIDKAADSSKILTMNTRRSFIQ